MDRTALIEKLAKCKHNPIRDTKALELFKDEGLKALESHCAEQSEAFQALEERAEEAEEKLTALEEKEKEAGTKIKTLEGELKTARKPLSEEDWMKQAPASIRGLVERQQKVDAEHKEEVIEQLKAAQDVYDEDALKAMSIEDLDKTAKLLKLNEATGDFSASRPKPKQRNAEENDVHLNPPDPYAEGLKSLQARYGKSVN